MRRRAAQLSESAARARGGIAGRWLGHPWGWLLLGIGVTALAGNRFNVALLGWVSSVPWLIHLRTTQGWRARLWLLLGLQLGVGLQVAKIVTEPISWSLVPMFSIPSALGVWLLLVAFEALRRRLGDGWGLVLFPALSVVGEWLAWRGSGLGAWGSSAGTQLDNLALLQTASLCGLAGVVLLTSVTSATLAVLIASGEPRRWLRHACVVGALVLAAHAYGAIRLARSLPGPVVTVAGVVSDVGLTGGGLPSPEVLEEATEVLLQRSVLAARRGAQLIVWNEGAVAVEAEHEAALLQRGQALAREHGVDLVMAYVVPVDGLARFENKYVWLTPTGPLETYLKHHPVPGEGSIRGTEPLVVHQRPYGRVAGAICYDYDFPALGLAHARGGAGLVVVPSSDWAGIDPQHTLMARIRGIEGGFSVLRPVRWATSGAYDALGRARGTLGWFEDNDRVLIAQVPVGQLPTVYAVTGDVLPQGALVLIGLGLVAALRRGAGRGERRIRRGLRGQHRSRNAGVRSKEGEDDRL
ncbi:MAG TPA: hypothetical protein ENK18_08805 [Deltaproteobacteria bacterium]|nr:hypothetical protein [Deltaproteobacteria bacterium]